MGWERPSSVSLTPSQPLPTTQGGPFVRGLLAESRRLTSHAAQRLRSCGEVVAGSRRNTFLHGRDNKDVVCPCRGCHIFAIPTAWAIPHALFRPAVPEIKFAGGLVYVLLPIRRHTDARRCTRWTERAAHRVAGCASVRESLSCEHGRRQPPRAQQLSWRKGAPCSWLLQHLMLHSRSRALALAACCIY
eukprot:COSAG05_NODE_81_length_21024_cov_3228.036603_6_plen_189_part_00